MWDMSIPCKEKHHLSALLSGGSTGQLEGIETVRPKPGLKPNLCILYSTLLASPQNPYQSLGTRFVLSTYSPHIQASPPMTRAFCAGVPEGKQQTMVVTLPFNYPSAAFFSERLFHFLNYNVFVAPLNSHPASLPRLWPANRVLHSHHEVGS